MWAIAGGLRQGDSGATSDYASARYRALIPGRELERLGHEVQFVSQSSSGSPRAPLDLVCDVLIVSKSCRPDSEQLARAVKERGGRVVTDFCDDHFGHPRIGRHFKNLCALSDHVVASTPAMADAIRRNTGRESVVISDPIEGPRCKPQFAPRLPRLRVIWFGHPTNVGGVAQKLGEVVALGDMVATRFSMVTAVTSHVAAVARELAERSRGGVQVQLVPWSVEATWEALEQADVAWIPVADCAQTVVKSPNRLIEALWAGRLTVADPVPTYVPFADVVPIGRRLKVAVAEALEDPSAVELRLREAQRRIARSHSAFECGRQWAAAIGDSAVRPLRLNLGCGDKILPGYVNVDVVEKRGGTKPDVVCDLHDLSPFSDACAEEVLSVHVVEHFCRWEIRDVLREWMRVLRPGGQLIVECPNMLSACRTFLENPYEYSREDRGGQRTMWVFYGDPKWKDPLMVHRWGYTPDSLKALLSEVGLADVRQEPARFKLREPRDMRVVGVKP